MVAETCDTTYYKTENDNVWIQYNKPDCESQAKSLCQSIIKPELKTKPDPQPTSIRKPRSTSIPASADNMGSGLGSYKFLCEICKKAFADKRHLNDHMMRHEGRQYKCEFCPKSFSGVRGLQLHTPLHTGKYPFHCDSHDCTLGFNFRKWLEAHQAEQHGKPLTSLNCKKCRRAFCDKRHVGPHQEKCIAHQ